MLFGNLIKSQKVSSYELNFKTNDLAKSSWHCLFNYILVRLTQLLLVTGEVQSALRRNLVVAFHAVISSCPISLID